MLQKLNKARPDVKLNKGLIFSLLLLFTTHVEQSLASGNSTEINADPTTSFLIVSGIDGTEDFSTRVCPGAALCFDVFTDLVFENQEVVMTWDSGIPGASFSVEGSSAPVGHFCWTPSSADARVEPYNFTVSTFDQNTPLKSKKEQVYSIFVSNPNISLQTIPVSCHGRNDGSASITSLNIDGNLQYFWSHSDENSPIVKGLKGGYYSVVVSDESGCSTNASFFIDEPQKLDIETSSTPSDCHSGTGTAMAFVSGGTMPYLYSWLPGNADEAHIEGLNSGWYTVNIEDANGCKSSSQIKVSGNGPEVEIANIKHASCEDSHDGSVQLNLKSTGSQVKVEWKPEGGNELSATGLAHGNYEAFIVDENGCSFTQTVSIGFQHRLPALDLGNDKVIGNNETIVLDAGPGFSSYLWSDNSMDEFLETNQPGTYSILVTDEFGCQSIEAVELRSINDADADQSLKQETLLMHPNPAKENVFLNFSNPGKEVVSIDVYTLLGSRIPAKHLETKSSNSELNVHDLNSGIYLIHAKCGEKVYTARLVKL